MVDMSNSKLLLFDIDGTLLSAHGSPKEAMATVLARRYEQFQYDQTYDFSGRTDPQIVEHLLQHDNREFTDRLIQKILHEFCAELKRVLMNGKKPEVHPGVEKLMQEFNENEDVCLGLVTGNVSAGAKIKLKAVDLHHYFPIGGYGDDSKNRNDLPPIARKRAEKYFKQHFNANDIWVIGDSIYDIECAQVNGFRCLAVSTGKTSRERLITANPEYLEDDLSDTEKIRSILINS
jgi:phosphoglycolate phosphatase-like HAD superfamily hydrolase